MNFPEEDPKVLQLEKVSETGTNDVNTNTLPLIKILAENIIILTNNYTFSMMGIYISGRRVPIFSYFSQHTPIFPIFFFLAISSYFSYFLAILHVTCIL